MNRDGKCFEHPCALSELYCKNNCALKKILNKQLFCNCLWLVLRAGRPDDDLVALSDFSVFLVNL